MWGGVLAIESVLDNSVPVHIVQNPVSILKVIKINIYVWHRSCEHDYFIIISQFVEEFYSTRPYQVVALLIFFLILLVTLEVNQCFVQIQNQSVNLLAFI